MCCHTAGVVPLWINCIPFFFVLVQYVRRVCQDYTHAPPILFTFPHVLYHIQAREQLYTRRYCSRCMVSVVRTCSLVNHINIWNAMRHEYIFNLNDATRKCRILSDTAKLPMPPFSFFVSLGLACGTHHVCVNPIPLHSYRYSLGAKPLDLKKHNYFYLVTPCQSYHSLFHFHRLLFCFSTPQAPPTRG